MARIEQYICDWCGVQKGTTNGWIVLTPCTDGAVIIYTDFESGILAKGPLHYCGAACAQKKISHFLGRSAHRPENEAPISPPGGSL